MFLEDTKPDSLAIYADWLEDNGFEEKSTEIREGKVEINAWCFEYSEKAVGVGTQPYLGIVGTRFAEAKPAIVGVTLYYGSVGSIYRCF